MRHLVDLARRAEQLGGVVVLSVVGLLMVVVLHSTLLNSYTYGGRYAILLQVYLTNELREYVDHAGDVDDAPAGDRAPPPGGDCCAPAGGRTAAELVSTWLHARIFIQREDINLFFCAVAPMVATLIAVAAAAAATVLAHLFRLVTLLPVTLGVVSVVGAWSCAASYLMAYYALHISRQSLEQMRLLQHYRLARWASGGKPEDEVSHIGAIAGVFEYLESHDNPPTILGVDVTPKLIGMLNRSVASVACAAVVSYVSDALGKIGDVLDDLD